mgnify:CR=1 FL=1
MISVEQRPLTLTPSGTEHIYTFSSTNSGYPDYRFVADIYRDATTDTPELITRLILSPNSYSKGIMNVERIVKDFCKGNARSESPQYTSETTTGNTAYGLISNVKGISSSNGFNDNTDYNKERHVTDYRIMIGEQFKTGTTLETFISTDVSYPGSTFLTIVGGASNTDLYWYGAGANINQGDTTYSQGIYWELYDQMDVYRGSGTSTTVDGILLLGDVVPAPEDGDYMYVCEEYTGICYKFNWQDIDENPQWVFESIIYPTFNYQPFYSPPSVTLWPGTTLSQGSKTPYVNGSEYWDTTSPSEQQDYWESKYYLMSGMTISETEPSRFLTSAGNKLYSFSDSLLGNVVRGRRRKHHPECPMIVSYFNGILSQNTDFQFINPLDSVYVSFSSSQSTSYPILNWTEYDNGIQYTGMTPQNDRIKYLTQIRPDLPGGKVAYWAGTSGELGQWDQGAYSELLEFYMEDNDCLSDPVHMLFLNKQGVWDTYTFDVKALKTMEVSRKSYATGGIQNTNIYSQLSTNRRDIIYDQNIVETMNVSSWYLSENDKEIVDGLFMSPEIYIIEQHDWDGKAEKTYNPYLIPVTLKTNTITEFKNRYNKLVQFNFDLQYTPINKYNTQG